MPFFFFLSNSTAESLPFFFPPPVLNLYGSHTHTHTKMQAYFGALSLYISYPTRLTLTTPSAHPTTTIISSPELLLSTTN